MSQKNLSKTVKTAKTENSSNVSESKKDLLKKNLEGLKEKYSNLPIEEKKQREEKSVIYIYPDSIPKSERNNKEGKAFRRKRRIQLDFFASNINLCVRKGDIENLEKYVEQFDLMYKTFYTFNDYSIESISQRGEEKEKHLIAMLDAIKTFKAS